MDTNRTDVYRWLEHDDEFAAGYQLAEVDATERLEEAAYERAVQGVTQETPIFYRGKVVDSIVKTEYSDTLLIFLLKARAPEKYGDKLKLDIAEVVRKYAARHDLAEEDQERAIEEATRVIRELSRATR